MLDCPGDDWLAKEHSISEIFGDSERAAKSEVTLEYDFGDD
jgi:hypothetical protein